MFMYKVSYIRAVKWGIVWPRSRHWILVGEEKQQNRKTEFKNSVQNIWARLKMQNMAVFQHQVPPEALSLTETHSVQSTNWRQHNYKIMMPERSIYLYALSSTSKHLGCLVPPQPQPRQPDHSQRSFLEEPFKWISSTALVSLRNWNVGLILKILPLVRLYRRRLRWGILWAH